MISHRMWFSPDQFFFVALLGTPLIKRTRQFIHDWGAFLALIFGYEFLRGLIPLVSKNVHIFPMIRADIFMFGFLPTIRLQELLFNSAQLHWYDFVAVILYICHFVTPMIVGYYWWLKERSYFTKYALGLLLLSYAAFVTYIIFPAMPPWMASSQGIIPPIKEVTGVVMSHFLTASFKLPSVYSIFGVNPVAAMPSLHAAWPFITFLFIFNKSKRLGLLFLPYVLGVWFSVVYLGEHYFIDVIFGSLYALLAFWVITKRGWFKQRLAWLTVRQNRESSPQ